jgi:hypothetical protein
MYNSINLRQITNDSKPYTKIRLMDDTTMILLCGNGDVEYGRTRCEKDNLVGRFNPKTDLLLWAWVGNHHTDIFTLTKADLEEYYK